MICVYFFTFRAHAPRSLSALNLPWLSTQFVGDPAFAFSQADVPRKISARDFKRPQPERSVDISPCCTRARAFVSRTERGRDDYKLLTRHGFPCGFPGEGSTDGNHHTSVDASSTGLIVPSALRTHARTQRHLGRPAHTEFGAIRRLGRNEHWRVPSCLHRPFIPFCELCRSQLRRQRRPCTEPSAAHHHCRGARTALATPTPAPNPYARAVQAHCSASNGRNYLRVCKSVRWGGIRPAGPC